MQMKHTKNLNPERFELGSTLRLPNQPIVNQLSYDIEIILSNLSFSKPIESPIDMHFNGSLRHQRASKRLWSTLMT